MSTFLLASSQHATPWPAVLAYQLLRTSVESTEATYQADYHTASFWPITPECAANDGH